MDAWVRAAALLTLALSGICPLASAQPVEIAWDRDGRFMQTLTVLPGKFAEVCGPLTRDQTIRWIFSSERRMNFNIHYHQGKQIVYPAHQDGVAQAQGQLDVEVPQDYCWMWTNTADALSRLQLTLHRFPPSGR